MAASDNFINALAKMEDALANILNASLRTATPAQLQRLLKLVIKKEIILEFLLEELPPSTPPIVDCNNCKFHLGVQNAPTTVTVDSTTYEGSINVNVVECAVRAENRCNPNVDNFSVNFTTNGNTINFTQGRRIDISCTDDTAHVVGIAQASGNTIPSGNYIVTIDYSESGGTATWVITAESVSQPTTTFSTTFQAAVTPETFIAPCTS